MPAVPLVAIDPELQPAATKLAARYGLPVMANDATELQLELTREGLQLCWLKQPRVAPLQLSFTRGKQAWRQQQGGGRQEAVVRALGVQHGHRPRVLDATAGLGRDAMMLAHSGCQVALLERHPALHALLDLAVQEAALHERTGSWVRERVQVLPPGSLFPVLPTTVTEYAPEAVYLDPMFPEHSKKSQVKKDMQMLQALVGPDEDADQLLPAALALASHRVVVKRPARAPFLRGQQPSHQIQTKKHRFDVYMRRP